MRRLPLDDAQRLAALGRGGVHELQQMNGGGDGAERVSQLVAEHGEELILDPVRRLGLAARGLLLHEQPCPLLLRPAPLADEGGHR